MNNRLYDQSQVLEFKHRSAQERFDQLQELHRLRRELDQMEQKLWECNVLLWLLSAASAIFAGIVVFDVLLY